MSLVTFWTLTLKKNAFHAGVALVIWMKKWMMMKTWQVSLYPQKPPGQTAGSYLLSIKFDVEILFYTEELGCDIHETNDEEGRYFDTRYLLDDSEDEMSYYSSFGEFAKEIEDMTGEKPDKFEDVDDILERHELSETMNAHRIDIVSLQDF